MGDIIAEPSKFWINLTGKFKLLLFIIQTN